MKVHCNATELKIADQVMIPWEPLVKLSERTNETDFNETGKIS